MQDDTKILLLSGSPSSGKTTVARQLCINWLKRHGGEAIHIELDDIRHMVVSEVLSPGSSVDIWLPMAYAVIDQAKLTNRFVVIEGLFFPQVVTEGILNLVGKCDMIELSAPIATCIYRNSRRELEHERLRHDELLSLCNIHRLGKWQPVNSSSSVSAACIEIEELLDCKE